MPNKTCVICGKIFRVPPNREETAKCCSMICRNKLIRLNNKQLKINHDNIKYIQDICVLPDKMIYDGHKVYMNGNYPAICINHKNHYLHRYVWEQTYGSIPKGMVIHHKDFNRGNWNLENLELLTRAEHMKRHKINRWRKDIIVSSITINKEEIRYVDI